MATALSAIGPKLWSVPSGTAITASFLTAALFALLILGVRAFLFSHSDPQSQMSSRDAAHGEETGLRTARVEAAMRDWPREVVYQLATGEPRHTLFRIAESAPNEVPSAAGLAAVLRLAGPEELLISNAPGNKLIILLPQHIERDRSALQGLRGLITERPKWRARLILATGNASFREYLRGYGLSCACRGVRRDGTPDPECGIVVVGVVEAMGVPPAAGPDSGRIFVVDGVDDERSAAALAGRGFQFGVGDGAGFAAYARAKAA